MTYSLIPIVALIIAAILNWDVFLDKNYPVLKRHVFVAYRFVLACLCVVFVTDILWGVLDTLPNKIPNIINTSLYFAVMSFAVTAWLRFTATYLEESKRTTFIIEIVGIIFFLGGLALTIVNIKYPILFSYEGGVYDPGIGRYGYFASQMGLYLITSIFAFIRMFTKNGYKRGRFLVIALVGVTMSVSLFLQIIFPNLPLSSLGHIITLVLVHSFIASAEKADVVTQLTESTSREQKQSAQLEAAIQLAYQDPLTGIKNKHAYVELEEKINKLISEKAISEFCVFIFDLNDLKLINDTYGHEKGDVHIIKSVVMIKKVISDTDIYRLGGDEFVVILQGDSYKKRYDLLEEFNEMVEANIGTNEPIVALGFSDFVPEQDNTIRTVFARADERMYARKKKLKEMASGQEDNGNNNASESISRLSVYELFYNNDRHSLINYLNNSSCDEIVEVDLVNDTFKQFYHVVGKYFLPTVDVSYRVLVDFTANHIVHPDDVGAYLALMKIDGFFERLANAKIPNFDLGHFRYKLQDGDYRYVEQCVIAGEENGIPPGMFRIYIFDVHNLMTRRIGVTGDETGVISIGRDQVTGLLTGKDFFKRAEEIVKENQEKQWCIIFVDIEHFKFFDEWYGREKGDYLLAKVGAELFDSEKEMSGVAGYFGQDDFAILAEFDKDKTSALYERIRAHIASFGLTTGFLPALGVALLEKGMNLVDVFDRSSIAASKAKGDVRNRICYYNSDMQYLAEQEYRILTEFMYAIKNDEITFYLQPQCRASSGRIAGVEALARWIKKDGTMVSPAEFIPILEKYNFVTDLDQYLWDKICKSLSDWIAGGHRAVPISINVSRIDIYSIDVAKAINDLADKYHIPHKLIKIEITESAYAETTALIEELVSNLRKNDFSVLMDDFGSGYSSLNMLSSIKLDAIKLDSNFLRLEGDDYKKGVRVIESVVNMAKTMSLPIIVEGVETKQQADFLIDLGCRYIQGFYFYKPMPKKEFEQLMLDENNIDDRGFVVKTNEQFRIREFLDKNLYSDTMLNNILGPVAFYSWHDEHIDIVRFNQQFYQAVNVPDFATRLDNIEQFVPSDDVPGLFAALKEAMENRLTGATGFARFARSDGLYMSFRIHFYYLGKREDGELFYGAASNDSETANLKEAKELIAKYSIDNMIFISKVNDNLVFNVVSHGLSDIFGIAPIKLEEELNNNTFFKRVTQGKVRVDELDKEYFKHLEKKEDFEKELEVFDKDNKKIKLVLKFRCVAGLGRNIDYILKCEVK